MKIKPTKAVFHHGKRLQLTIMKFFIFLLCTTAFGFTSVNTFSQEKITIDADKEVSVDEVFRIIKNQTEYRFLYPEDMFSQAPNVKLKAGEIELGTLLNQTLAVSKVRYKLSENNTIVIETPTNQVVQGTQITGTIKDQNGVPLPGVNIIVKGTNVGTQSDFDGNYAITTQSTNDVLVFSYIGYATKEIAVGNQTTVNVVLQESLDELDEVVVIGYGTVKKRDLTGAVSSVDSEEIRMAPTASPLEAIQGRVAGLDITRNDGRAGSGISILLRGNRSLTASSEPIYIIDGIQGNPNNLNPNDIESIDVLKDASSTAIYGSAGANGVIIITTKKGEDGKIQVDVNSYLSINSNPAYPSALQGDAWFDYLEEGYLATNGEAAADRDALLSGWGMSPANLNPYINNSQYVDWAQETFRTGIQTNNTLSIRGGNDKVRGSLSLGQNKTEGIYPGDDLAVYTMRSDLNIQIADWIKAGVVTGVNFRDQNSNRSRVNRAFGEIPLGDIYDENGNINQFPIAEDNGIISILANNIPGTYLSNNKSTSFTANPYVDFTLAKGLTLRSILGVTLSNSRSGEFKSDHTYLMLTGSENAERGASYSTSLGYGYNWENILDYKITLNEDHDLGATFITSYANNQSESSFNSSTGFISDNSLFFDINAGINNRFLGTGYSQKKRMSYAGRLNYNYKGKYLLTGSVRADGVSQLSATKKWDVFPAGAVAWRISDENFMEDLNWLSNLKLRVGYGVSGNSNIDAYATVAGVEPGRDQINLGGGLLPTYVPSEVVGNDFLGWEKSYNLNVGLDFGFLHNRIYGSLEYYETETKDVIYGRNLPSTVGGFGPKIPFSQNANIAEMNNKGIELTLNTKNIVGRDFQWTTTFTFGRNTEEVGSVDLGNVAVEDLVSLGLFVGSPKDVFYDYKKIGIWQLGEEADAAVFGLQPGDVKIESSLTKQSEGVWVRTVTDDDGNSVEEQYTADNPYTINANDDRQIIGHEVPKWTAGLQNTFVYKGFDLNVFATARYGQTIDGELLGYFSYGDRNLPEIYDYWTPTNPTNDYPRPYISRSTNNSQPVSGLNFVDGSYFKIKNITLGYTFPERFTNNIGLSNLRLYGTMYNALIVTKSHLLKGLDPETSASDSFPLFKQMVFGLNVSF